MSTEPETRAARRPWEPPTLDEVNSDFLDPDRIMFLDELRREARDDPRAGAVVICQGRGYCEDADECDEECPFCVAIRPDDPRSSQMILAEIVTKRTTGAN